MIFVKQDGDHVLFSTIKGRRKMTNMSRDPRVNLLIHGLPVNRPNYAGDGPNYAAIAGFVHSPTTHTEPFTRRCTTYTWAAPRPLLSPERNE